MDTKYTNSQIQEFLAFCEKHQIRFNFVVEFKAAIDQYFQG
jgi:hypothetical protein